MAGADGQDAAGAAAVATGGVAPSVSSMPTVLGMPGGSLAAALAVVVFAGVAAAVGRRRSWSRTAARAARTPGGRADPRRRGSGGSVVLAVAAGVAVLVSGAALTAGEHAGGIDALREEGAVVLVTGVLRTDAEVVTSPWDVTDRRCRAVLVATTLTARGSTRPTGARLVVTAAAPCDGWARGAVVRVSGPLADTPVQGLAASVSARTAAIVRPVVGLDSVVAGWREGLRVATEALAPQARGLVPGMTLGDTSRVPAEVTRAMRDVGLTHLTAVSGTHVAVVVLVVGAGASAVRAPRLLRAVLLAVAVATFVLLVHPEPSVLRAALMGLVGVGGLLLGRGSRALPALAATVVLLLVVDPGLALTYGFVLSVAATAAIVLLAGPAAAAVPAVPRWAALAVTVPVAAQSACGPILVLLDPAVSVWAVPANVLAAPAVLPATVLGLLATAAAPVSPALAHLLAEGAGVATGWIAGVAVRCADLPGARLDWDPGVPGAVALAAVTALGWVLAARVARTRTTTAEPRRPRRHRSGATRGRLVPCPLPRARPRRRR